MNMSKKPHDPLYRNIETGAVVRASKKGLELHLWGWQEAKDLDVIPPDSSDYERPNELSMEELIEMGISYLSECPEDWELIKG